MEKTANLKLNLPALGDKDWNIPLNENFTKLDSLLEILFPVGGVYIGLMETNPLEAIGFGVWEKIEAGRYLRSSSEDAEAGMLLDAGIPDLQGAFNEFIQLRHAATGVFNISIDSRYDYGYGNKGGNGYATIDFVASRYNSNYREIDTVQPASLVVNIWRRIA